MHDRIPGKGLQRAALARATNCNLETIRYYETIGVMPAPPRTTAGYRMYDDSHVRRLHFVLRARELGFSIKEIRGLLQLLDDGKQACAEVKARTEQHLVHVRAKIAGYFGGKINALIDFAANAMLAPAYRTGASR